MVWATPTFPERAAPTTASSAASCRRLAPSTKCRPCTSPLPSDDIEGQRIDFPGPARVPDGADGSEESAAADFHVPNRTDYVTSGRRRALAEAIASPDNPLTARVMVNRIWGWHFGTGIVTTPGNFGKMGTAAVESRTARLAGDRVRPARLEHQADAAAHHELGNLQDGVGVLARGRPKTDPTNVYLWRFPPHRVEAENHARHDAGRPAASSTRKWAANRSSRPSRHRCARSSRAASGNSPKKILPPGGAACTPT